MRQTICQECGAVNKAEAVVCSSCGVQLDHAEKRLFNRLKEQGFFSRIASAPFRLIRWILKKIKLVLSILAVSLVVGGGFILFLIFAPMGWPDYSDIPQSDATHKEAAKALAAMKRDESPRRQSRFPPCPHVGFPPTAFRSLAFRKARCACAHDAGGRSPTGRPKELCMCGRERHEYSFPRVSTKLRSCLFAGRIRVKFIGFSEKMLPFFFRFGDFV